MMIFFRKPEVKGLLVGLVIIFLGFLISLFRYQGLRQLERNDLIQVLAAVEQNIERTILECHNAGLTLALTVNASGEVENFNTVAARILKNNENIDILELLPEGVIEYVYPLEGNESVVGYDVLNDPRVSQELVKASDVDQMFFAGPFELKQGGMAVVGRLPIFFGEELWGYSAILIYLETLINQSGVNSIYYDDYYFQLAKTNPNTGDEEYFLPIREDASLDSFEKISFPDGNWKLYASKTGKSSAEEEFIFIMTLSFVVGLFSSYFSTLFFRKPEELKNLLEEKSQELLESHERYKNKSGLLQSILESPKDMEIFSLDRDLCYLAFTSSHKNSIKKYFSTEISIGDCILDNSPDQFLIGKIKNVLSEVLAGKHIEYSYRNNEGPWLGNYFDNKLSPIFDDNNEVIGITAFIINVTARVKAELKSTKHEKRFKALIENGSDGIAILNLDGTPSYVGPSVQQILGYNEEEVLKLGLVDLVHEEDLAETIKVIENASLQPGVTIKGHTSRMKHKDGSWRWIEAVVTNLLDDPTVQGIVDNFRDVTDKVEAEKELEKVLEQLRNHLENSPLGVIEYDNDLHITKWSKKCEEIFGWNEQEMLGKHAYDFIYKDNLKEVENVGEDLSTGEVNGNISYNSNYTKSGKIVDCIWYNSIIKNENDEVINVMSLVEDITLKNRAEEQLIESEYRFRTLVKNSPYCIHEIDMEGTLISINKAGLNIVGLSDDSEIVGLPYLISISDKDLPRISDLQKRALKGEGSEFEYDSVYGKRFLSSFVPIKDKDGKIQRLMGMTQDVTERKKNEEMIANSLREKTTLLSEIHHRVKNNLAIVSGLLELQSIETNDERLTSAFNQSINRIISIAMVHELMYKSQDLSSININSYLELLLPAITRTLKDDRKEIAIDIDIEDYKMNINEAIPIGLLFNELFTNSFKYAFEEGKKGSIKVSLRIQDCDVVVVYEDNGKGFTADNIFDEPKNLGLTLIHTQISQLNATYKVETESKFKLEFRFSAKKQGSHSNISS